MLSNWERVKWRNQLFLNQSLPHFTAVCSLLFTSQPCNFFYCTLFWSFPCWPFLLSLPELFHILGSSVHLPSFSGRHEIVSKVDWWILRRHLSLILTPLRWQLWRIQSPGRIFWLRSWAGFWVAASWLSRRGCCRRWYWLPSGFR